jgi:hypothetical protein
MREDPCSLMMSLSDAGFRPHPTKLIYLNHRLPSLAYRRRDPRSLQPIVRRYRDAANLDISKPSSLSEYSSFAT